MTLKIWALFLNYVFNFYLCVSDGDRDKIVGPLALFLLFLCVLFTVHSSCTVSSLPLSLLLGWFWTGDWREEFNVFSQKIHIWKKQIRIYTHPSSFHVVGLISENGSSDIKLMEMSEFLSFFFFQLFFSLLIFCLMLLLLKDAGVPKKK